MQKIKRKRKEERGERCRVWSRGRKESGRGGRELGGQKERRGREKGEREVEEGEEEMVGKEEGVRSTWLKRFE